MSNNVVAQVVGGKKQVHDDVETVADVRNKMGLASNYTASINGEPASDTSIVDDSDFVTFAESVKGA